MKQFFKFITFLLTARNTFGFGVHSPSVFDFITNVIYEKNQYYIYPTIEKYRRSHRILGDISSSKGQLLFRITRHFNSKTIVELGAKHGISTAYLAANSAKSKCYVLGSEPDIRTALDNLKINNVELLSSENNTAKTLNDLENIDLIVINSPLSDSYAQIKSLLKNISEQTLVVFDCPHLSHTRLQEWRKILKIETVTASVDLWGLGIVFFNPNLERKQYSVLMC
jgi:predicted O-methyltransferase YrrM